MNGQTEPYDPAKIERAWRERWRREGTNSWSDDQLCRAAKPFYNLMMFPYPSAEGLHVGNVYAFVGADVYGRFQRLRGNDVFEPIGFDAFGIHSENHALQVGAHPTELIPRNIERFTGQLKRVGLMLDWSHTVDTTSPGYYRWTQWLFLQLYRAGLAVKKEAPVNWCPSCKTVLANEQVVAGECERCGTPVEIRTLSQWFFRITEYAGRLLENLKRIDWSESTRKAQENWIGRSEGAQLRFAVAGTDEELEVYTTRPDTVFGATYMVLAPEHPLVERITTPERSARVEAYRERARATDLVNRQKSDKVKTGADTGARAVNPATGEEIPVWVADYVLMEYGTGAIMAVPAHDERDFEFARRHDLLVRRVVAPRQEEGEEASGAGPEGAFVAHSDDEVLVASGRFSGMGTVEGSRRIVEWLASRGKAEPRVNYRLHDWCISRQRYWGPPIPVVYCDGCGTVPVPEQELPVILPRVDDFRPDASGVSPLARVESWYRTACPRCGGEARRETDVSDTFLDSAWYFLRYPSANSGGAAFEPELTRKWLPVDSYIGGNEHAVLHLLYARFITMALKDLGHLGFEEPFTRFRAHGLIVKDGAKMSKSRGNVVVPDEYIEEWGADTFRTYLMFMGPYQEGGDFRDAGISGPHGFLARLWDTVLAAGPGDAEGEIEQKLHATVRKVTGDLESLSYHTAIAALMEYLNEVRTAGRTPRRGEVEALVPMIAPFAPHLAEELWSRLGGEPSLFDRAGWPGFDPGKAAAREVEFVVQVNGKVRARLSLPRETGEEAAREAALRDQNVLRFIDGREVRKVVFVPGRLVNLVV